jgi:hypothetical protein
MPPASAADQFAHHHIPAYPWCAATDTFTRRPASVTQSARASLRSPVRGTELGTTTHPLTGSYASGLTANEPTTCGAATYMSLRAWLAVIAHTPTASSVTADPATVHTLLVAEVNVTKSPELALALTATVPAPNAVASAG